MPESPLSPKNLFAVCWHSCVRR